jgi:hypothetical protein
VIVTVVLVKSGQNQRATSLTAIKTTKARKPVHPSGFGSLVDTWNATHSDDWQQSTGTSGESNSYTGDMPNYDPDPSLPLYGGYDPDDTYTNVSALDGRVTDYTINLHLKTTLKQVFAVVAGQLPKNVHREWISHQDGCVEALYASATLARTLRGDDPNGGVFVEAEDDPLSALSPVADPTTFTDVSLSRGTSENEATSPQPC